MNYTIYKISNENEVYFGKTKLALKLLINLLTSYKAQEKEHLTYYNIIDGEYRLTILDKNIAKENVNNILRAYIKDTNPNIKCVNKRKLELKPGKKIKIKKTENLQEYNKAYYNNNKEKQQQYYSAHKEKIKEYNKERYRKIKEILESVIRKC